MPNTADRAVFRMAPYLSLIPAFIAFSIVPIGGVVTIGDHVTELQLADPPIGILILLLASGIGLYGVMLAGWSSGSKYPLLGSVRASAQLLSYEAALGLAILGVLVHTGTLSTRAIVDQQRWTDWHSFVSDWYLAPCDRRVRHLPDRRHRRDQPSAVRPRRGRAGARRRVPHRVHGHPLRALLPGRVHERRDHERDRGDAVPRRPERSPHRVRPQRRQLDQRLDRPGLLVPVQAPRAALRHRLGARIAPAPSLRPAHELRVEVPDRDRVRVGRGLGRRRRRRRPGLGVVHLRPARPSSAASSCSELLWLCNPKRGEYVEEIR